MTSLVVGRDRLGRVLETARRALAWALLWVALTAMALYAARSAEASPKTLLTLPAVIGVTFLCTRFPAATAGTVLFIAGAFGSIEAFTPLPATTMIQGLIAGMLVGTLFGLMFRRGTGGTLWSGAVMLLLVLVIALVYVLVDEVPAVAMAGFRSSWIYVLAALVFAYAPWPEGVVERVVKGLLATAVILGGYAVYRWIAGPAVEELRGAFKTGAGFQTTDGEVRVFGAVGDRHGLSAYMAALLPFCLACMLSLSDRRWRLVALVGVGLTIATIIGTEVRSALAAAIAGSVVVIAITVAAPALGTRRLAVAGLTVLVALVAAGATATFTDGDNSRVRNRFEAILNPARDPAFQERQYGWRSALREIDEKPLGHGLGTAGEGALASARFVSVGTTEVDSSYLKIAYEQGLMVMILFGAMLLAVLFGLIRAAALGRGPMGTMLAIAGAGSLVAFAIQLHFESAYIAAPTALVAWAVMGLGMRPLSRGPRAAARDSRDAGPARGGAT